MASQTPDELISRRRREVLPSGIHGSLLLLLLHLFHFVLKKLFQGFHGLRLFLLYLAGENINPVGKKQNNTLPTANSTLVAHAQKWTNASWH